MATEEGFQPKGQYMDMEKARACAREAHGLGRATIRICDGEEAEFLAELLKGKGLDVVRDKEK